MTSASAQQTLLDKLDTYYDAVPRAAARVEDHGSLTLFVRTDPGWPYYARPTRGASGVVEPADVARVRARQRELGVPESFEWVAETTPSLRAAVEASSGLVIQEHPLMVLPPDAELPAGAAETAVDGVSVRIVGADDPALAGALAAPRLAFAAPGTGLGEAGVDQLAAAALETAADGSVARVAARIGAGLTAVGAAVADGLALCAGQHQPVGRVSEIVGVGTLPAARRQGLALAVTAALVTDARARGVDTVFLSADDETVARIYARLGFRRIGTALTAEPATADH
ncbi:GNAT family N-acetyltransferase [Streptomyces sp. AcH 505]|uniref:GNAT family N-acetyltransferase n=1 Tax=Streptomyces sp. AcH 505 TaxID=352211 RepID=UPI0005A5FA15